MRIGGLYREHHLLGHPTPNPTGAPNLQLARWNLMLEGWKAAAAGKMNCAIVGDLNLDYTKWNSPNPSESKNDRKNQVRDRNTGICTIG